MFIKNLKIGSKILFGSSGPLILAIILGVICFLSIEKLLKSNASVDHTHIVIREAMKIEASAVDMETGMRGYLLAGQENFLEPYKSGKGKFQKLVVSLQKTVDDNPPQVKLLDEIKLNIDEWLKEVTQPMIELRRKIGDAKTMDDIADLVGEAKGKVFFDKFRSQIETFVNRENALMIERQKNSTKTFDAENKNIVKLNENTKMVDHTHKVIRGAMNILASAVDMETGMRGYLLAGRIFSTL